MEQKVPHLTLLHSERPKLYSILAFLSAVGLTVVNILGLSVVYSSEDSFRIIHFSYKLCIFLGPVVQKLMMALAKEKLLNFQMCYT